MEIIIVKNQNSLLVSVFKKRNDVCGEKKDISSLTLCETITIWHNNEADGPML